MNGRQRFADDCETAMIRRYLDTASSNTVLLLAIVACEGCGGEQEAVVEPGTRRLALFCDVCRRATYATVRNL
jgi:hypothetical protein